MLALVILRTTGRWAPWLDEYVSSGQWHQHHRYAKLRDFYNKEMNR